MTIAILAAALSGSAQTDSVDDAPVRLSVNTGDKIQTFSQEVRYGFKNLFPRYTYVSGMAWGGQVNESASGFVSDYVYRHGAYLTGLKEKAKPYFSFIENILNSYGLPPELKYIAVIESNLGANAMSVKGAYGPWQFMAGTAREYNLTVNDVIDERTDYLKSTHAAARYLSTLFKEFGDWMLVMAAYNGGPGRVESAIRKTGSRNFWDLQYYLPEESRTYVKRFIATHYVMENGAGLDIPIEEIQRERNLRSFEGPDYFALNLPKGLSQTEIENMESVRISGYYRADVIAKHLGLKPAELARYNPKLDDILSKSGGYDLRLPSDQMDKFQSVRSDILNESLNKRFSNNDIPPLPKEQTTRYRRKRN